MYFSLSATEPTAVQTLPFTVSIADASQLPAIAAFRAACYKRHIPELGAKFQFPEHADHERGCEVLVASSKVDGAILASMRMHTNALRPLPLEASIDLPASVACERMVEAARLAIAPGAGFVVRDALFKGLFMRCAQLDAARFVITGRSPVDRMYERMGFTDVGSAGKFYPMSHIGGIDHRVMTLRLAECVERLPESLRLFIFDQKHPDIILPMSSAKWACDPALAV